VDLASLQVFQTVVRERSFSRAAEKLYRTQPAVSISIRKLEEWVGQPLFVRGSGAKLLTDAGLLLVEYADRMLNLREEISKSMKELRGLERGQLSIGVNESSIHALLPAIDRYRTLHSGIRIRVHRVFSRDVPRELLSHHLDIGVISYLPEERELTAVEFYRDQLALVVWPGHHLAKRKQVDIVDIKDLAQETFIGHIVESPYRQRVVQMFARHKVPLSMDLQLPTIESIKLFVEMKRGVAIVPRMCVEQEVSRGDLRELRIRQMDIVRKLYLVYRQDRPLTAAAQEMIALLTGKATGKKAPEKSPTHRSSQQKTIHAAGKSLKPAPAAEHAP
jgi:DNA-binding transcriptional LysR family regulator